jgi:hypothetical protein
LKEVGCVTSAPKIMNGMRPTTGTAIACRRGVCVGGEGRGGEEQQRQGTVTTEGQTLDSVASLAWMRQQVVHPGSGASS